MEQAAGHDEVLRRLFDVQDAAARGHPLRVAVGDGPAATVRVVVLEDAIDDVGDGFETAVRMPGRALRLARRVLDLAHLVHVHERVERGDWDAGEGAAHGEALAFEAGRGSGDRPDGARVSRGRVGDGDAGQGERIRGHGWHGVPPSGS